MQGWAPAVTDEHSTLTFFYSLSGRNAGKDQSSVAVVLNAMGDASRSGKNDTRPDWQVVLTLAQEKPLTFQNNPDMVTSMHMRMDVLPRLKTPERGTGMAVLGQNHFVGFFVTETDFVAIIVGLGGHFVLQVVK